MKNRLEIIQQSSLRVPRAYLTKQVEKIFEHFCRRKILKKSDLRDVIVVFLDEKPAKKVNYGFRQKNHANDVLSFDSISPDSYGELVICPQVIRKQAKEHGLSFQEELLYMVIHGWLHLLGFDHETSQKDARIMFQIQDEIFEKLINI